MSDYDELTGQQKVAIVMAQLSPTASSTLLKAFGSEEAVVVATEIARLPPLERDLVEEVLEEFVRRVNTTRAIGQGGAAQARRMLAAVVGEAQATEIMSARGGGLAVGPLALLAQTEPARVVPHLLEEHPQTVAAVLAHMPPAEAARLLDALPTDRRSEVAMRIATLGRVAPEAVSAAVRQIAGKLRAIGASSSATPGGVPALVDLLSRADGTTEKVVLAALAERDPVLAEAVRSQMFTFDDVVALDDRALQVALRTVEIAELALALRGLADNPEAVARFTGNLSERAQEQLAEEMEVMGSVRGSQIDNAQAALVRIVRDLEANGSIVIHRSDETLV